MRNRTQIILENGIYLLIWAVVFTVPLLGYHTDSGIRWTDVNHFWLDILPFFILFAVNNYLLLPILLNRKRSGWYVAGVILTIILLFMVFPLLSGKFDRQHPPFPPRSTEMQEESRRPPENSPHSNSPKFDDAFSKADNAPGPTPEHRPPRKPMPVKWGHMLNDWLLAILIVGFNIAIRLLFKTIADARRMKELESQTLKAELNYLKGQINPHFFMNTLNNIHALIDLNTGKAKVTVIELSKIMHYMLYESDRPSIPLAEEIGFLNNYIALMRIRYLENVHITVVYPDPVPDVSIPPLLLITLLENAFKHGIKPDADSYIHAELSVQDGRLHYTVRNTQGVSVCGDGTGLENLRKRLELLYDGKSGLKSGVSADKYITEIIIPIEP